MAAIDDTAAILRATGVCQRAVREGDPAPDATLLDASGAPVKLSGLWRRGPLVASA